MLFEPKFRFLKIIWRVISFFLGGGRSIQLSYGDNYEIPLILRGFSHSGQGPGLYSEAVSIRKMAFLLMDFRPLKTTFEKLFILPILEKRSNHDAIQTEALILKILWRVMFFFEGGALYPTKLRIQLFYYTAFSCRMARFLCIENCLFHWKRRLSL